MGNLVESIVYQNKDIFRKEINRYDFNNKLFERISFGKDGKLRLKTTFIYSDNGRLLSEVSNPGEDLDFIDKIICKESKITYEYFNDSLLSKKIQIDEGIKKNVEEYLYDDYFRLSKVYEIEGNIKKLRDIYSYYDNNNLKEIESFYDDSRVKWIYSINGDTLRLIRYDKKSKIVFSRIDILDSNGRHLKMNSFNSLGEPTSINKFYYEYY